MKDERPLHVRVAEALGWHRIVGPVSSILLDAGMVYEGHPPGPFVIGSEPETIPRYDTDWSVTGPLIQKYGINLECAQAARPDNSPYAAWRWWLKGDPIARGSASMSVRYWADTPLVAVCHLILALAEAGRLPK